jgi:hypothetical protein
MIIDLFMAFYAGVVITWRGMLLWHDSQMSKEVKE